MLDLRVWRNTNSWWSWAALREIPECLPGTFGLGGNNSGNFNCSGGGGGWYGGGAGAGGGGGSSYIGGVTGGSTTSGMQSGNGLVIISYIGTLIAQALQKPSQ
ncbi:MAG: hypothetical protein IPM04_13730 [Saprospiraceae bacterium]|nr:hypothetical protein [Candidatus Brachybacter algidus]MBK8748871.1 hypothetical protein [Candidatus Brachybacter algidus]